MNESFNQWTDCKRCLKVCIRRNNKNENTLIKNDDNEWQMGMNYDYVTRDGTSSIKLDMEEKKEMTQISMGQMQ